MPESNSETAIINAALHHLGQPRILARTDNTARARVMNDMFEFQRDTVLAEHPWNEATKRAALASTGTAPVYGYTTAYQLPADFLRLIEINLPEESYRIEQSEILTDLDSVNIRYVFRLTDVPVMSPGLKTTIAKKLAAEACLTLTGSVSRSDRMWTIYQQTIDNASFVDNNQAPVEQVGGSTWINARFGTAQVFRPIQDPT